MLTKLYFSTICLLFAIISHAQIDREFWFAAPDVYEHTQTFDRPIVLRFTSFNSTASVTVSMPANPAFTPITTNIAANSTATVDLTAWINLIENTQANIAVNKGLLIQSTSDITAYYEVVSAACQCNPEAFALKGKNAIGNEFYISSSTTHHVDTVRHPGATTSFEIVATQDNTVVTITPSKPIIGHAANVPFTVTLNRGQTYSAVAQYRNNTNHLSGSHVTSTNPVAITLKDDLLFGDGTCADLAGDQTIPVDILGNEYIVTRGFLNPRDYVYITATEDNTELRVNGNPTPVQTLSKGETYVLELTAASNYITATKKIYVYQVTGNGCEVGSAIIPKLNCTGSRSVSVVRSSNQDFAVMITTKSIYQNNFTVNGNNATITAASFSPVAGTNGEYVSARVDLSGVVNAGSVLNISNSQGKFSMGFINGSQVGGCRYGFFSDFKATNVQTSQAEMCAGDSVILNAFGGVSYQWFPVTGISNPLIAAPKVSPAVSTEYSVKITDAEGCVDSAFVQVRVNACNQLNNVGGIINDYTEVLAYNVCDNSLLVKDAGAYNVGDTVLLIQMKGASINTSNTSNFGNITNYQNAGNYEFNYISAKNGNTLALKNNLTRTYTIPSGKVQLVRVPYYESVTITSPLTCKPWDGNTGGVLVLNAKETITLNAAIDVTAKGFRGGGAVNTGLLVTNCAVNDFIADRNDTRAALKGESIVLLPDNQASGKGAPAAGGGGGLDHNSGGGGGGNGGAGGFGGYQLEPCGNAPFDNRGIGGRNLAYNNAANKIFPGSGGGAGHQNNPGNQPLSGGTGGGIAIIMANALQSNTNKILANGEAAMTCNTATNTDCHDGTGGGGAGGTVLLNVTTILDNTTIENAGGKGANMTGSSIIGGRIGPGGGGGGGVLWLNSATIPANITNINTGGAKGVLVTDNNNGWGTTDGQNGITAFNLAIPVDNVLFKKNIDSVRIQTTKVGCSNFDFKGLGYTNTAAIIKWEWQLGDGNTATTQDVSHNYNGLGTYTVKLKATDANGCVDSFATAVTISGANFDFSYKQDVCNPLTVQFFGEGNSLVNPYWLFGDGNNSTGSTEPSHTYPAFGSYIVKFAVQNNTCVDTITKTITIAVQQADIIITPDTTICAGNTKQLRTAPSLNFCWTPTTWLNDPNSPNPITSTPHNITYYFNAQVLGSNLIVNGDFSAGNTGFTSSYNFTGNNTTEGEYFVGSNPTAWNAALSTCGDHTSGNGNMMLVNGSPALDVNVWRQTVTVTPNTNYAFATWIQALWPPNPAQLQFSINGQTVGDLITAVVPTCNWSLFYTTWNSGNNTTATIAIVNKNTAIQGNDFALDDISFSPVTIRRDSVIITIDSPAIKTNNDTTVCINNPVPLSVTGGTAYSWSPAAGLSTTTGANPVASVSVTTEYIVTGTTSHGCQAKDTIVVSTYIKPVISITNDTAVCQGTNVPLVASGGNSYSWSPAATLNNPAIANPIASPIAPTLYKVQVTDNNNCTYPDSVLVNIITPPAFSISPNQAVCIESGVVITANGGTNYQWSPAATLSDPFVASPVATPLITTTYSVHASEAVCNYDTTMSVTITVNPKPRITAQKSNDIDCTSPTALLTATGASSYLWSPAQYLDDPRKYNPIAGVDSTTTFHVTGTNQFGCSSEDSVRVQVSKFNLPLFPVPNAFTPNGDTKNECFGLRKWGDIQLLEFSIYNRWGQKVFSTTNPADCWDGTYKGKYLDMGGYAYVIRAKTFCGDVKRTGIVLLIR